MRVMMLTMIAAIAGPPSPSGTAPASAGYAAMPKAAQAGAAGGCGNMAGEIVVCADRPRPPPRLPLPDERAPRVALPNAREDSAASWEARLGCRMGCNPIESAEKGRRLVKILAGEDPDD